MIVSPRSLRKPAAVAASCSMSLTRLSRASGVALSPSEAASAARLMSTATESPSTVKPELVVEIDFEEIS